MDGGRSLPESAVRYFAVIGVPDEATLPEAGDGLPVQVLQRYPQKDHKDVRFPPALASFCFPRGGAQVAMPEDEMAETLHGFVLTNEAGDRCFGAALHIWCFHSSGACLLQRALAVVSTQPLWGAFRAFLYSLRYSGNSPERFVVSFVSETPLPPPGFQVIVPWPEIPAFALQRPAPNQLPLLDLPVRRIFQQLKPDTVITIVEALLLEHRIVLHSVCMSALCAFGEILVGLIWPLRPAAVYVPLLPDALVDFCGAPLPFVLGISSEMVQRAEAICEPQTMFVDIDHGEIRAIQENCMSTTLGFCSTRPGEHRLVGPRPRPAAPDRPHKKLLRRLDLALRGIDFQAAEQKTRFPLPLSRPVPSSALVRQRSSSFGGLAPASSPSQGRPRMSSGVSDLSDGVMLDAVESPWRMPGDRPALTDNVHSPEHILAKQGSDLPEGEQDSMIRRAFLWFMTDLLVEHSRFTNGKFDGGFDQAGFLAKCSETERPFLKELTSTQMWASWISRRLASGEDSKDIVLFDEVIAQKLNRKTFTLSKTATPFLSLDFSEKGHYREVRVPDPPRGTVEPEDRCGQGAWRLEESRLYKPRPMEAMPVPTVSAERPGVVPARDPLPAAPLMWYVQHCWLLTWAAYLPDRPEQQGLQWAKMDLCLGVLHKMTPGDPRDQSSPPPHDLALSMLAAACARCGALRVDLAERLFTWMKARRLVAATHPQSLSVFFERFVQLCASDTNRHEGSKGPPQEPLVPQSPGEGPQAGDAMRSPGRSPRRPLNASLLLFQDLKARPRIESAPKPALPRLTFSLQCRFCTGKLSLEDVDIQWARVGAEASSNFQCPHCRAEPSTLKLSVETGSRDPTEIDLLHPKRLALALRELDSLTGPEWLARLARDYPHWRLNLLWHFRRFGLFDEHLLAVLEAEKAHKGLTTDGMAVRTDTRSRLRSTSDTLSVSETLQGQVGTLNSVLSLQSPGGTLGGTFEVLGDGANGIHEGMSRRNTASGSEPKLPTGAEVNQVLTVERLRMELEDLRSQLDRRTRRQEEHEEAASAARKVLGRSYGKVLDKIQSEGMCSEAQSEAATSARQLLGRAYGKVLEDFVVLPAEPRPCEGAVVPEEQMVLRCVASAAVAKAVASAVCRLLPAGSAGQVQPQLRQAPDAGFPDADMPDDSRPALDPERCDEAAATPQSPQKEVSEGCQRESELEKSTCPGSTSPGDESTDGARHEILSAEAESGHGHGHDPVLRVQVPQGWDKFNPTSSPSIAGDGAAGTAELELESSHHSGLADHELRERVDRRHRIWNIRKMRRAWRVWRTEWVESASSSNNSSFPEQGTDKEEEERDKEEAQEEQEEQELSDSACSPPEGPRDAGEVAVDADAERDSEVKTSKVQRLVAEGAAVCKSTSSDSNQVPTEDTEQERHQSDTSQLQQVTSPSTSKPESQATGKDSDHANLKHDDRLAHDSAHDGLLQVRKPLAPPLAPSCDEPWIARRRHPHFQQSALLASARDSCAVPEPQPRRSASAPPERRNRGRRHRIVPRVISTGLATAPTSAVPSPNSVFPTPLLPKERSQASRALMPERGRDRRSKSVTAVTGAASAWH